MTALTSVSGFPRIGSNRELKKIIEGYWKGANTLCLLYTSPSPRDRG